MDAGAELRTNTRVDVVGNRMAERSDDGAERSFPPPAPFTLAAYQIAERSPTLVQNGLETLAAWSTSMFHHLSQTDSGAIIVLTRTRQRFQDSDEVELERTRLRRELDGLGRAGRKLLIDSRAAPLSTDQHLGEAFSELRRELQRGFERIAVILETKVGLLQAIRLASTDLTASGHPTGELVVFETEEDALKYLRESAAAAGTPSGVSIRTARKRRP